MPPEILARDNLRKLLIVGTPSIETIGIGSVRKISIQSKDEISDHRVWLESFKKRFIDGLPFQYPKIRACDTALRDMVCQYQRNVKYDFSAKINHFIKPRSN